MDEHDPLIERLRGLGRGRIDPAVAGRHLGAMAGVRSRTGRFVKLKVGAAFAAGLVFGGTGLASAGVLPASVQDAAHGALSQVGVSVPRGHSGQNGHGPARYNGPECAGGPYANHGQYVRAHKSDPNAGASRCGKPIQAGSDSTSNGTEAPETPEAPESPGTSGSPGSPANGQGDHAAGTHGGHGHGKPANAPSPGVTAPGPLSPSTTVAVAPANQAPASSTSTSTSTSTTTTTVEPTTSSTSSTTAPSP
ncbi:MAG TPA: hypothetical protein VFH58_01495 [Acidimicrobiales bacterium]|nr:hypothetical protein [Acidimicrobiales bacterium]